MHTYELEHFQRWQEWSEKMLPIYLSRNLLSPLAESLPVSARQSQRQSHMKTSFSSAPSLKCNEIENEQVQCRAATKIAASIYNDRISLEKNITE